MKKYKLQINGNPYDVQIIETSETRVKLEVNGTKYWVDLEKEVKQSKTPTLVRAQPKEVKPEESIKASQSVKKVTSPLPGTIMSIAVEVGTEVKVGDTLLVLEAMKMENTIQAESSGKIKSILVKANSSVLQGDTLMEIE